HGTCHMPWSAAIAAVARETGSYKPGCRHVGAGLAGDAFAWHLPHAVPDPAWLDPDQETRATAPLASSMDCSPPPLHPRGTPVHAAAHPGTGRPATQAPAAPRWRPELEAQYAELGARLEPPLPSLEWPLHLPRIDAITP